MARQLGASDGLGTLLHRGLERGDVTALIEARTWMASIASRDCDCREYGDTTSQVENPCDVCQARAAMDSLDKVIEPRPRTLHPERLTNMAEKIYFEVWEKANERLPFLNGGYTAIEHLLNTDHRKSPSRVSQHDMTIATTIVQYLGTNGGRCVIDQAEREIKARNAVRQEFGTMSYGGHTPESWKERMGEGELFQIADDIASTFISRESRRSAHDCLRQTIINAFCKLRSRIETAGPARVESPGGQAARETAEPTK